MTTVFQRVRVGPYEIGHEIGRGGMAVVFVATDSRDGRCVALKLVPAETSRDAQEVLEAERWGAKLQEQFCRISQNVPVVYEHGTEGGYFYIAMLTARPGGSAPPVRISERFWPSMYSIAI